MTRVGRAIGRSLLFVLVLLLPSLAGVTQVGGQGEAPKTTAAKPTATPKALGAQQPEIPLYISASQLEADQDQRRILFQGKVKAVYGDASLYADQLMVFYKPQEKGPSTSAAGRKTGELSPLGDLGGEKLDRIEAKGNVRFVQGDRVATGEKAIFYRGKDEIVLLGRPQVWRGENHLRGSKIIFNLATNKVIVEGSSQQRVEAHLYQATERGKPSRGLLPAIVPRSTRPDKVR